MHHQIFFLASFPILINGLKVWERKPVKCKDQECGCSTSLLKSMVVSWGLDPAPYYITQNLEKLHGAEPLSLINPCDGSGRRSAVAADRQWVINWAERRWV